MYNSSALTTYHSKLDILTVTTINKAYLPIIWNLNADHQHGSPFLLADTVLDVNTSLTPAEYTVQALKKTWLAVESETNVYFFSVIFLILSLI